MQTIGTLFNQGVLENLFELSKQYLVNGKPTDAARTLETRGDLYSEAGLDEEALAAWQQALKTLRKGAAEGLAVPEAVCDRLSEKINIMGGNLGD